MLGHELRNPLAPMTNAIAVMERAATDSDIFDAARSVLDRQLKQMKRLVDDLLDVGRITAGKIRLEKKPVLVRDALAQAVEAVAPTVQEKDHSLTVDAGGQDLWVVGDRARLAQVITNLLGNAAKYTPPRGQLHVSLVADRNVIEIRVKDNGPGIPESLRANIFNLFVQGEQDVARSQGGLGLGLALVEQLVTLHGGDVAAYSNPEVRAGSEFVVRLPRIAAPPSNKRRAENQRKRILVVDDNHDSADTLGMLVRSLGYEAEVVYDGDTALAAVIANVPDVVLLDLGLPTMDGYEVARRIEAEVVDPPELVAISGYGQDSDREATFRAGFHAHLSKPVSVDDLAGVLKRLFS
jgi:CheY-like chemotaxis protein/two-component sensor histidine kinase